MNLSEMTLTRISSFFSISAWKLLQILAAEQNLWEHNEDTEDIIEKPQVEKGKYTKTKQDGERWTQTDEMVWQLLYSIKVFGTII